ncbi:AraC family transcriptional regulator [Saccharomonospora saliphila]|uniref:AraC family transcriptional regulator n=1 Tax=Saccharomonospora saliphila TaxID=369829 RepID=UPI00066211BB
MAQAPTPLEPVREGGGDLVLRQRDVDLDGVRVWTMRFSPVTFRRTPRLISRSDPGTYNVVLVRYGALSRTGQDGETGFGQGELHVNDSSRPFELRALAEPTTSCVGVEIPKTLLPLSDGRADALVGRPLSAREGLGALLADTLTRVTADHGSYRATDGPRVAAVLRDLLSGLFAHALEDVDRHVPAETRRRDVLLRVRAFVDQHLHDPGLDPGAVAAAHHVSTSYLHRLFQDSGVGVSEWIRQRRLEHARRDLADPSMGSVPVWHIARRWGFVHHAAFSRAFRSAYGLAPRDYRAAMLGCSV